MEDGRAIRRPAESSPSSREAWPTGPRSVATPCDPRRRAMRSERKGNTRPSSSRRIGAALPSGTPPLWSRRYGPGARPSRSELSRPQPLVLTKGPIGRPPPGTEAYFGAAVANPCALSAAESSPFPGAESPSALQALWTSEATLLPDGGANACGCALQALLPLALPSAVSRETPPFLPSPSPESGETAVAKRRPPSLRQPARIPPRGSAALEHHHASKAMLVPAPTLLPSPFGQPAARAVADVGPVSPPSPSLPSPGLRARAALAARSPQPAQLQCSQRLAGARRKALANSTRGAAAASGTPGAGNVPTPVPGASRLPAVLASGISNLHRCGGRPRKAERSR